MSQAFRLGDRIVRRMGYGAMPLALAWLLHRAPNILPVPGASSLEHQRENLAAAQIALPEAVVAELDAIGSAVR